MSEHKESGIRDPNISTEHQKPGDAARPADTLDRDADKTHPPRDFDPTEDVGKAEPGAED